MYVSVEYMQVSPTVPPVCFVCSPSCINQSLLLVVLNGRFSCFVWKRVLGDTALVSWCSFVYRKSVSCCHTLVIIRKSVLWEIIQSDSFNLPPFDIVIQVRNEGASVSSAFQSFNCSEVRSRRLRMGTARL